METHGIILDLIHPNVQINISGNLKHWIEISLMLWQMEFDWKSKHILINHFYSDNSSMV